MTHGGQPMTSRGLGQSVQDEQRTGQGGSSPRPNPTRSGNAPAYTLRRGNKFQSFWAMHCLDCGGVTGWHVLLSAALTELAWHQEMHRVWRSELRRSAA